MKPERKPDSIPEPAALRENLRTKSVHGVLATAIGSGGDMVLRLVSISILAHLIIPEHFGLIGMITAVTAIAAQVSHLGLGAATMQRKDIDHGQLSNLFWINAGFGLLLCVGLSACAPVLAAFFHDARLVPITVAISTSFVWTGLAVQHEALLARRMQQAQTAVVRFISTLLSATLAVTLALYGFGYWALVWQEVARTLLLAVGAWVAYRWVPGLPRRGAGIRSLLHFGRDMTLTQFLNAVFASLDRLLLGRFFGPESVGLYRQAQQLIMVPTEQLNAPIQSVSQPLLSLLQDDADRYRRYLRKIVFSIGLITMPFAAFAAVYAQEATLLILGPRWIEATILFRLFAIWAFIRPVLGMAGVVLITCGQANRLLRFSFIRNVTFLLFTLVGINWGAVGVGIAQVASSMVLLLPCLIYSFAQSPVTVGLFMAAIRVPLIASATMASALLVFRWLVPELNMMAAVACGAGVGAVSYLAGCLATSEGRRELTGMLEQVWSSVRRRTTVGNERQAAPTTEGGNS